VLLPVSITVMLLYSSSSDRLSTFDEMVVYGQGVSQSCDCAKITISPDSPDTVTGVKLVTVSRRSFLAKTAGADLTPAVDDLPANLTLQSPFYQVESGGVKAQQVTITLPLPAGTKADHLLDLYSWDGQSWLWLPHRKIAAKQLLESGLNFLPESVAVMQAGRLEPKVSLDYQPDLVIPGEITPTLKAIIAPGLLLTGEGELAGAPLEISEELQAAKLAIIPLIRQQNDPLSEANPIDQLLIDPQRRDQHIEALVALLRDPMYRGIELDYGEINHDLGQDYATFLTELRQALPKNKQLSLRLPLPQQLSSGAWDTGGYDWPALGQIADVVKVPTLPDPKAYGPGGNMEALLDWAVTQINRYKLQLILRANSIEQVGAVDRDLADEEALTAIGEVVAPDSSNPAPGQRLDFSLADRPVSTGIRVDEATGVYWLAYLDEQNQHHTIYLSNLTTLTTTLQLVGQYNLGGVTVQNLAGIPSHPQVWPALNNFLDPDTSTPPIANAYTVTWQVQAAGGRLVAEEIVDLSDPAYSWTVPETGGDFEVAATIFSGQSESGVPRGRIAIQVPTPAPTPAPQPAPAQAKQSASPPPPAYPTLRVPFAYGIQADPRGDIAANIGHIKALGFNWVKFQMAWKNVESAPGDFSWALWDQLADAYSANGIKILLSIPKAPDWVRPFDDDKSVEGPPQDPFKYAEFVGRVAARYRGRVQAIEVWNEQNLWYEAGGAGRMNAANYVQLLQLAYQAIKSVNPDMIVISGGLTPAGDIGDLAIDDIRYLQQMYDHGARGYFDALGAHPSGYNCPVSADWRTIEDQTALNFRGTFDNRHHSWCFRGTMEGYREVMVANGDGDKVIVPTEFGWAVSHQPHVGYEYAADNTPEEQAQWVVEAYQFGANWGWVGPMFLWNLDYGLTSPNTELADFGIIDTPAYHALAAMPK
jgi:spore germination protein YaaH